MGGIPIPKESILDQCVVVGIDGGKKVYRNSKGDRFYTWDTLHGELEVFNKRGRHLGVACYQTGDLIKPAIKGRRINKQN